MGLPADACRARRRQHQRAAHRAGGHQRPQPPPGPGPGTALCADTTTQSELFLQSQGISPLRSVTEDTALLDRIFDETQGTSTFNSATIGEIMRTAAAVPQFAAREQALAMADTAVANALANNQSLVTALPTAQREIDLYLQNTG